MYTLVLVLPLGIVLRHKNEYAEKSAAEEDARKLPRGFTVLEVSEVSSRYPKIITIPFKTKKPQGATRSKK